MITEKISITSKFILFLAFIAFIVSCNSDDAINTIIIKWNESHNKEEVTAFDSFYADKVNYYGEELSKN